MNNNVDEMRNKKVVIFDFDGVIVDRDSVISKINETIIKKLLFDEEGNKKARKLLQYIFGMHFSNVVGMLRDNGLHLSDDFVEEWLEEMKDAVEKKHEILIPNAIRELATKNVERCIASNGNFKVIQDVLEKTGHKKYFPDGRVFTASDIEKPKPYPDLFLFAANQCDAVPENCIVIEDSITGITAALAAKIKVLGFVGGTHANNSEYIKKVDSMGVPVVRNESHLIETLIELRYL